MKALTRPTLYLVTARHLVSPGARTPAAEIADLERWLDVAIDAGIDAVQIRERDLGASALAGLASRVIARARPTPTMVLMNARADVALAARADGVHLRGDGPRVEAVRALGPPTWIVGRSVHPVEPLDVHQSADYLLFGTVFSGGSKPADAPVAGLEGLRLAVSASPRPVIAIGGITPDRVASCLAAGAAGVAAIGVYLPEGRVPGALGAARAVRELRAAMDATGRQG